MLFNDILFSTNIYPLTSLHPNIPVQRKRKVPTDWVTVLFNRCMLEIHSMSIVDSCHRQLSLKHISKSKLGEPAGEYVHRPHAVGI